MPIFHNLELLTLADIHNLQFVSFVYECVNGLSLSYFDIVKYACHRNTSGNNG